MWFGEGEFGTRLYILQNGVVLMLKKKKINRTLGSSNPIPNQPIFGLIDLIGLEP